MSERIGDIARRFYMRWQHRNLTILQVQEKNLYNVLGNLRNHIFEEILEDASCGAKFRRFYYNDLNTTHKYTKPVNQYEIELMLKNENLNVSYEKDSFVVTWKEPDELK